MENQFGVPQNSQNNGGAVQPPVISLPKGGGAIRGMGEKFAANPVTGTGSMSVPIFSSPGRSGFGPQLALSYDSGSGNGPFGLGWSLGIPAITRKTDKGLPQYDDAGETDVYILSGAEDLVPEYEKDAQGHIRYINQRPVLAEKTRTIDGIPYLVRRYRPRVEGLFARIERWTNQNTAEIHWRSISRENITTLYGTGNNSRIFDLSGMDEAAGGRIFSWLISHTCDGKGNAMAYEYKPEDDANIDRSLANEQTRLRTANRYVKRIFYGNRQPYFPSSPCSEPSVNPADWLFELVFDYGEHDLASPTPAEVRPWTRRNDPFSAYRSGFEIRTYRLCERVLMFHRFAEQAVQPTLVRSTDFYYRHEQSPGDSYNPDYSFLVSATQTGFQWESGHYLTRSMPPLEFTYSRILSPAEMAVQPVRTVDPDSLENLPIGLDGAAYQWQDLDGEGAAGILTEQAGSWYYKPNLSANHLHVVDETATVIPRFGPMELVARIPSDRLADGAQLLDLAGDGQVDLVQMDRQPYGFYERTAEAGWESFRPFTSRPEINLHDPNLRFVDLTGDGHADILITQGDALVWYPSLTEEGFGPACRVSLPADEELGPGLVFADETQTVTLADLSGDGLTDLVRIRNGEICYWPNLGYGRFGRRVSMDHAPVFDMPDSFDPRRIRLADLDGSGTTDILYLGADGARLYFNQSGNSWSESIPLPQFPSVDHLAAVQAVDLLGNGTACLVWSSPLPAYGRQPMQYVELIPEKPHLLIGVKNNLGAETGIQYASSTRFYLEDKQAGRPWITRLPFPVHVVERTTVTDAWRKSSFSSVYSYHHGYYDGVEREFRGFGRVDQVDTETFDRVLAANAGSPYISDDLTLYQPPVKTVTWFHTGACLDRKQVLSQYADEYFPHWFEDLRPNETNLLGGFRENDLPEPDLEAQDLTDEEWRQALRACKGMPLRQEVYELDVDTGQPVRLFSTAYHNCRIQCLQPQGLNKHAVFLATESEAVTYHYELDLRSENIRPDPRITHTLNLKVDDYGNVLQSVAVGYPRIEQSIDPELSGGLSTAALNLIQSVQNELHIAYTEARFTNKIDEDDDYRLQVPCETLTYELTGLSPADAGDLASPDPRDNLYFSLDELRALCLSGWYQPDPTGLIPVGEIPYQDLSTSTVCRKRPVEHVRMLYFKDDDPVVSSPLSFRQVGRLGLQYETYKLALTDDLLQGVFGARLADASASGQTVLELLKDANVSGYLSGQALADLFPDELTGGQYWIRSGTAGFANDAAQHYYLPERYVDPFGNITTLQFDSNYDLYLQQTTDACGNSTAVVDYDFRVLAPRLIRDVHDNYAAVAFDVLGMPVGTAVMGKRLENGQTESGNTLDTFIANLEPTEVQNFFTAGYDEQKAREWLGRASGRYIYSFGEQQIGGRIVYGQHPACACAVVREEHVNQQQGPDAIIKTSFEYEDGMGQVLVMKGQAEPEPNGTTLRWIASGKTILNNKGKPVRQYEPYFSPNGPVFEDPPEVGVSPIMYYDAPGRLIRTESPDGSFSRVTFSPWFMQSFDANDTILEPGNRWFSDHSSVQSSAQDQRAAGLSAGHAATPALQWLDSLGRPVINVAHNRSGGLDEKYVTFTRMDAEGKPLWIRDARGNLVMQYILPTKPIRAMDEPAPDNPEAVPGEAMPCYDISGNLLFQHSMDAGERWMITDAAGKPMFSWDANEKQVTTGILEEKRLYFTCYDALHRPLAIWLCRWQRPKGSTQAFNSLSPQQLERYEYQDGLTVDACNGNGQLIRHYDESGLVETIRRDFNGNVLEVQRRLNDHPQESVVDWQTDPELHLEAETFTQITEYDALNRMTRLFNWHSGVGTRVAVYEPRYNRRGLLAGEDLIVRARKTADGYDLIPASAGVRGSQRIQAIRRVEYNARGQRELLETGNQTVTRYQYDPFTFRLSQLRTCRPNYDPEFPKHHSGLKDDRVMQQLNYTYDPSGNITEISDEAYEPVFFDNQKVDPVSKYEYDALYRLTGSTGRENSAAAGAPSQFDDAPIPARFPINAGALRTYSEEYRYDCVGNICQIRHGGKWTRNYEIDPFSNRLLHTWEGTDRTNAVITDYQYDPHGNMLNLANIASSDQMRWDHRDMIQCLNLQGGGWAYYNYDAGKQRTRKRLKRVGGAVEERIYLGGLERYRKINAQGKVIEEIETLHLMDGEQRLLLVDDVILTDNAALPIGPLFRYQYGNHLGSACLELDETAGIISYEEYHPYGTSAFRAIKSGLEAPPKRYRYTGKERDEESGLNYHGARYYAPWLERWVSCDPLQEMNRYSYVKGNPVQYMDPSGNRESPAPINVRKQYDAAVRANVPLHLQKEWDEYRKAGQYEIVREGIWTSNWENSSPEEHLIYIVGEEIGVHKLVRAKTGQNEHGEDLSLWERVKQGVGGVFDLFMTAMIIDEVVAKPLARPLGKVANKLTNTKFGQRLASENGLVPDSPVRREIEVLETNTRLDLEIQEERLAQTIGNDLKSANLELSNEQLVDLDDFLMHLDDNLPLALDGVAQLYNDFGRTLTPAIRSSVEELVNMQNQLNAIKSLAKNLTPEIEADIAANRRGGMAGALAREALSLVRR